jgi:hypothetical protein
MRSSPPFFRALHYLIFLKSNFLRERKSKKFWSRLYFSMKENIKKYTPLSYFIGKRRVGNSNGEQILIASSIKYKGRRMVSIEHITRFRRSQIGTIFNSVRYIVHNSRRRRKENAIYNVRIRLFEIDREYIRRLVTQVTESKTWRNFIVKIRLRYEKRRYLWLKSNCNYCTKCNKDRIYEHRIVYRGSCSHNYCGNPCSRYPENYGSISQAFKICPVCRCTCTEPNHGTCCPPISYPRRRTTLDFYTSRSYVYTKFNRILRKVPYLYRESGPVK